MGLHGISKGGDISLSYVSFIQDKVQACVIQNSTVSSVVGEVTYGDSVVGQLDYEIEKVKTR